VPGAREGPGGTAGAGSTAGREEGSLESAAYLDLRFAGSVEWLAPAALVAIPGLLIVAAMLAQLLGGIAWVPITRRLLGAPNRRSRADRTRAVPRDAA
jgi:hypothetical protein